MAAILLPLVGTLAEPLWQPLSILRGDDVTLEVTIQGDMDISDWTLSFWAALTWGGPPLLAVDGAVVNPLTRKAALLIGHDQTIKLLPGLSYVWEIRRTAGADATSAAVAVGVLDVPGGRP